MPSSDIEDLADKIKSSQESGGQCDKPDPIMESKREGLQAGAELVGAIGGGALIGYGLDKWLDTAPWFMLGGLLLGFVTALYNIYRITQGCGTGVGFCDLRCDAKTAKKGADS